MADDPRLRILDATVVCVGRYGMVKTTVEDVAQQAQLSRATLYRHFPGGREQLIADTIAFEVERFLFALGDHVADAPDFATHLERGISFARHTLAGHKVFQKVLETEPERLLPQLSVSGPMVLAFLRAHLEPLLAQERLAAGVTPGEAADWLARMVLSFIEGAGQWDLDDPAEVTRLVRDQLLVGVLAGQGEDRDRRPLTMRHDSS